MEGGISEPAPGGPFDAIVERLSLWTVPDPASVLREQVTVLRPGGLVVPIEADLAQLRWLPDTPFSIQAKSWIAEAFARAGLVMLGPRLRAVVQEAGLRPLGTIGIQPHHGPDDPAGIAAVVETIRNAAPLIVGTGVATAEELGVDTFEQRLTDELRRASAVIANPVLLSAWATAGPNKAGQPPLRFWHPFSRLAACPGPRSRLPPIMAPIRNAVMDVPRERARRCLLAQ